MKECTVKVYFKENMEVAHRVYKLKYTLKTAAVNAVAMINRKCTETIAIVSF